MRKIICFVITFIICAVLKILPLWAGFSVVTAILYFGKNEKSIVWEIPMAVLALSIVTDLFPENTMGILRIIIPVTAVLVSLITPKKLKIFFPVAIIAVILKNTFAVASVWAMLWHSIKMLASDSYQKYSTTKGISLQGNNSECVKK